MKQIMPQHLSTVTTPLRSPQFIMRYTTSLTLDHEKHRPSFDRISLHISGLRNIWPTTPQIQQELEDNARTLVAELVKWLPEIGWFLTSNDANLGLITGVLMLAPMRCKRWKVPCPKQRRSAHPVHRPALITHGRIQPNVQFVVLRLNYSDNQAMSFIIQRRTLTTTWCGYGES